MKELHPPMSGWIEVICGSMYSGKTEELIRRLRRAQIARQRVEIFKPVIDQRFASDQLVSHSLQKIPSRNIHKAEEILRYADEALARSARTIRLHGTIEGLRPDESVGMVLQGSGLDHRSEEGVLLIVRP